MEAALRHLFKIIMAALLCLYSSLLFALPDSAVQAESEGGGSSAVYLSVQSSKPDLGPILGKYDADIQTEDPQMNQIMAVCGVIVELTENAWILTITCPGGSETKPQSAMYKSENNQIYVCNPSGTGCSELDVVDKDTLTMAEPKLGVMTLHRIK
jgi:hypothetical protein